METSFTEITNKGVFPGQNEGLLSEPMGHSRGKQDKNGNFVTVADTTAFLSLERDGHASDMDISEDYPSDSRVTARKHSAFSVPLIRVEDWSSSESDMEEEFDESLPPFSFVGTREKVSFLYQLVLELLINAISHVIPNF